MATFDVTTYGAVGDGTTDDRSAIQDAIDAAEAAGGGIVYFPKGVYLLGSQTTTDICLMVDGSNVKLRGDGVGLSILKLGDDVDGHMVNFGGVVGGGVIGIEFDGNRANQPASKHCIRTSDDWTNGVIRDVYAHHASGYGIGLQFGTLTGLNLENILIEDTGSDGFDNKNAGEDCRNNRMSNVTVRRAGLNTSLTGQACIDLRGIWNTNLINCEDFNNTSARCNAGIRFRAGDVSTPNTGAHWSTLTNFYIEAGTTSGDVNGITQSATQVAIGVGQIQQCTNGILFNGVEGSAGLVTARDCTQGFYMDTDSNGTRLVGCEVRECSNGFYVKSDGCSIEALQARGCSNGVNLQGTSQNTVLSGVATANSTNNLLVKSGATWTNGGLVS